MRVRLYIGLIAGVVAFVCFLSAICWSYVVVFCVVDVFVSIGCRQREVLCFWLSYLATLFSVVCFVCLLFCWLGLVGFVVSVAFHCFQDPSVS